MTETGHPIQLKATANQLHTRSQPQRRSRSRPPWYQPTIAPEHGTFLVLFGAVLTGAALAQSWTGETTWVCIATFLGLQCEYPLIVQLKKRRQLKLRHAFWAGAYGCSASLISLWLAWNHPVVLWICAGALLVLALDIVFVLHHSHKSIVNEMVMFSGICLSTVFAYAVTTGSITLQSLGFWILNTLFFSSAVFTMKLRKRKTSDIQPGLIYHGVAVLVWRDYGEWVFFLYYRHSSFL